MVDVIHLKEIGRTSGSLSLEGNRGEIIVGHSFKGQARWMIHVSL